MTILKAVSGYGLLANRPAAGSAGAKYWATDTSTEYYDDGTQWQSLIPSGSSYTLPIASSSQLGGVKIGSGISVAGNGTISTSGNGLGVTSLTQPAAYSNWTWVNQAGATGADSGNGVMITSPTNIASDNVSMLVQALGVSKPYTVILGCYSYVTPTQNNRAGLILRQSSNGSFVLLSQIGSSASYYATRWNSPTSYNSAVGSIAGPYDAGLNNLTFFRIKDDGTNRTYAASLDGYVWVQVATSTDTDFITPDQVGFGVHTATTVQAIIRAVHLSVTTP